MADLIATSACAGRLPKTIGDVTLTEIVFGAITSVAPLKGQEEAVSDALKAQIGAALPKPNRSTGKAAARAVFFGRGQTMVLGPRLAHIEGAVMTDQTDAWAAVELDGPSARDVLVRLVSVDLRPDVFKQGHAARTPIIHMPGLVLRTGADRYLLMTFRSMAGTLVHDLETAMEGVAARG